MNCFGTKEKKLRAIVDSERVIRGSSMRWVDGIKKLRAIVDVKDALRQGYSICERCCLIWQERNGNAHLSFLKNERKR